jgi:hypothetical protein
MGTRTVVVLGTFVLVAALGHAFVSKKCSAPIHTGYVLGVVTIGEGKDWAAHYEYKGCRVECYDSFVVVYVAKNKESTPPDKYVTVVPWSKIGLLNLMPE